MIIEHLDRIVFTGDSVTDMQRARPVEEGLFDNLGHGYVRVIDLHPNWVSICIGINDVWRQFDSPSIIESHVFDDYFKHRHSTYLAWERIHPNQVGATLIARAFLKECEFEF